MSSLRLFVFTALVTAAASIYCPHTIHLAIGSYTRWNWVPSANGDGVTFAVLRPPLLTKTATLGVNRVGQNPSFLATAGTHLYIANVNAARSRNGGLTKLSFAARPPFITRTSRLSGGGITNHVAVLTKLGAPGIQHVVMVSNYAGSVTSFVFRKSGLAHGYTYVIPKHHARPGPGPAQRRQMSPHPHMVLPYRDGALVPDLGANALWRFRVIAATGKMVVVDSVRMQRGDGPRHAALHRSGAVIVVNELSLTLTIVRPGFCGRGLKSVCQRVQLVRDKREFRAATAAAVRVSADGRFVYASVRKHADDADGVICAFRLNAETGRVLGRVGQFSSGGARPRDVEIVERVRVGKRCKSFIVVANRDSDQVVVFERDVRSGAIASKPSFRMGVKTPTSVLLLGLRANGVRAKSAYF